MNSHLSEEDIEVVLIQNPEGGFPEKSAFTRPDKKMLHLSNCSACLMRLRAAREFQDRLRSVKKGKRQGDSAECPGEEVWTALAAGISTDLPGDELLTHAGYCDRCGPLLLAAAKDIAAPLSGDEELRIDALASSRSEWQSRLARRLKAASPVDPSIAAGESSLGAASGRSQYRLHRSPWRLVFSFAATAACAAVVFVVGVRFWPGLHRDDGKAANELIEQAYAEKRSIDLRIAGAPYEALQQARGESSGQSRMGRPALLRAEADIAQHLKSNPEDKLWQQASGRASLLEGDPEAALAALEKAHSLDSHDLSVKVDLASAFILRGELQGDGRDYGHADQLLQEVLQAQPGNEVAEFNDALALEKLPIKNPPILAWKRLLADHPQSDWAPEARQHLQRLEVQVHDQNMRRDEPLMPVDKIAVAFQQNDGAALQKIDARIEEYADLAVQQWLPSYDGLKKDQHTEAAKAALSGLAALMSQRHGDRWLADILAAVDKHPSELRPAIGMLADGEHALQSSDDDHAREKLEGARADFATMRVDAGLLRASFNLALIDQLERRRQSCLQRASALLHNAAIQSYSWLRGQAHLEVAACLEDSDPGAEREALAAKALAEQQGLPFLFLRALGFEAAVCQSRGESKAAWDLSTNGLERYWAGTFPVARGYNLLFNMQQIAERSRESQFEASILREAVWLMAAHPNIGSRAYEENRLGQALMESGDLQGATNSFLSAQELFQSVPSGNRKDELRAEGELGLSTVELKRGHPQAALSRLESIRGPIEHITDVDLRRTFYEIAGVAELRCGLFDKSDADLHTALRYVEQERSLVASNADRWKWSHENEDVNRAMVELLLKTDPTRAWMQWEQYKSQSLPALERENAPEQEARKKAAAIDTTARAPSQDPDAVAADRLTVTYFVLPEALAVWVWDGKRVTRISVPLGPDELESKVRKLLEYCANPESNLSVLKTDASSLFQLLLGPIEPLIDGHSQLVFEPDGILRSLPWEALIDEHGSFVGDRFSVAVSPGLRYLQRAHPWTGVARGNEALVVGDPPSEGFAQLEDAEDEAQGVAALFSKSKLLLGVPVTSEKFSREMPRAAVIHFSGHGLATSRSAGLVMGDNAILNVWPDTSHDSSVTRLVVLSACSSSRGSSGYFDDEDSLVREIIGARVSDVVASRWMVDSAATLQLMRAFYAELFSGRTVSASMARAARSIRLIPKYEHPFYWAGFSVFGSG